MSIPINEFTIQTLYVFFLSWMSYGPLTPKIIIVVPESYKANLVQ